MNIWGEFYIILLWLTLDVLDIAHAQTRPSSTCISLVLWAIFICFCKLYLSDSKLSNKTYSFILYTYCATLPPVTLDGVDIAQAQIPPAGPTYNNMQNYSCQGEYILKRILNFEQFDINDIES